MLFGKLPISLTTDAHFSIKTGRKTITKPKIPNSKMNFKRFSNKANLPMIQNKNTNKQSSNETVSQTTCRESSMQDTTSSSKVSKFHQLKKKCKDIFIRLHLHIHKAERSTYSKTEKPKAIEQVSQHDPTETLPLNPTSSASSSNTSSVSDESSILSSLKHIDTRASTSINPTAEEKFGFALTAIEPEGMVRSRPQRRLSPHNANPLKSALKVSLNLETTLPSPYCWDKEEKMKNCYLSRSPKVIQQSLKEVRKEMKHRKRELKWGSWLHEPKDKWFSLRICQQEDSPDYAPKTFCEWYYLYLQTTILINQVDERTITVESGSTRRKKRNAGNGKIDGKSSFIKKLSDLYYQKELLALEQPQVVCGSFDPNGYISTVKCPKRTPDYVYNDEEFRLLLVLSKFYEYVLEEQHKKVSGQ